MVGQEVAVARTGALTTTDSDRRRNLHKEDVDGGNSGQVVAGGFSLPAGNVRTVTSTDTEPLTLDVSTITSATAEVPGR